MLCGSAVVEMSVVKSVGMVPAATSLSSSFKVTIISEYQGLGIEAPYIREMIVLNPDTIVKL